jgi:hypothetical protein
LLRASGWPALKSVELSSVSVHPAPFRCAACALSSATVGFDSEQFAAP